MVVTTEHELFNELVSEICKIYGDNLISIILYGSVARNTATEDSDIDIVLLIKKNDDEMYDRWLDVAVGLDLRYDQLITTSLIEEDRFNEMKDKMPYYINIDKEGIVLWKAA